RLPVADTPRPAQTFNGLRAKMGLDPVTAAPPDRGEVRTMPGCVLPPPGESELLVLVSAHQGQGVSTAAIGSEDKETTTAEIVIETREQTLSLAAATHGPVIWRVSGAVERLRHLVLAGFEKEDGTNI